MDNKLEQQTFAELLEEYGMNNFESAMREKSEGEMQEDSEPGKKYNKKETVSIQAEIDLHGQTRSEAIFGTQDFIQECKNKNINKILVITGKSTGILKQAIKELLSDMQTKNVIKKFKQAPPNRGGEGAFVVILV